MDRAEMPVAGAELQQSQPQLLFAE